MEAMGEQAADHTAGWAAAPGLSAASLLLGRWLRSVPSPASRAGCLASDGGAATGRSLTNAPFTDAVFSDMNVNGAAGADSALTGGTFRGGAMEYLQRCLGLLEAAVESAPAELALAGFAEAADFAGLAEEISRRFEYLQVLGAAAVDRTRTEAINAAGAGAGAGPAGKAAGWITGWGHDTEAATASPDSVAASASAGSVAASGSAAGNAAVSGVSPFDDGCRNTAEFLRLRLRIGTGEARRRLALASALLPRTGITGHPLPPVREETAAALAGGSIASRAGTIITTALDRVRYIAAPEDLALMEHVLTRTAIENDQDFLTRVTHRWADASTRTAPNPPKRTSATAKAPSSAAPAADSTTSKSSPPPTNTNTSSPS